MSILKPSLSFSFAGIAAVVLLAVGQSSVYSAPLDDVYGAVVRATKEDVRHASGLEESAKNALLKEEAAKNSADAHVASLKTEIESLEEKLQAASDALAEKRTLFVKEKEAVSALSESVERHEILLRDLIVPHGLSRNGEVAEILAGDGGAVSLHRIQKLWRAYAEQLALTSRLDEVEADIFAADGTPYKTTVKRYGPFSAATEQKEWLEYLPAQKTWRVIDDQPKFTGADVAPIDPSFGTLMKTEAKKDDLFAHVEPAGIIGVFIGIVAAVALLLGAFRWFVLARVARAVDAQKDCLDKPENNNPLGRLILAANKGKGEASSAEANLDAALAAEMPALQKGIGTLAVLAGIPTLLGLLGTVSGMIETFTVMSRYGNNQPDLLAGGIAEALVTTELGLYSAIPILLLHCAVKNKMRGIRSVLEEEAAGLVAIEASKAKS